MSNFAERGKGDYPSPLTPFTPPPFPTPRYEISMSDVRNLAYAAKNTHKSSLFTVMLRL